MERRGPGAVGWIIAAIILLFSVGGLVATIAISVRHDVSSGYIPREARQPAPGSRAEGDAGPLSSEGSAAR